MAVFLTIISTLLAVIIGGLITSRIGKGLQDREFKKEARERQEILKCYLETLKTEIDSDYQRLWNLSSQISGGGYPTEYFDVNVKQTIMSEIIKTRLYGKHKKIFDRINSMVARLIVLNREISLVRDLIEGKYCSVSDQQYKQRQQVDRSNGVIGNILNLDIQGSAVKRDICVRLEEIIQAL